MQDSLGLESDNSVRYCDILCTAAQGQKKITSYKAHICIACAAQMGRLLYVRYLLDMK